jgi:hypothetical protein
MMERMSEVFKQEWIDQGSYMVVSLGKGERKLDARYKETAGCW